MKRNRAAYMRDYRARQRGEPIQVAGTFSQDAQDRIDALEEEVARLKRELASRSPEAPLRSFNSRPFTPVPK